jgi:DNA-binding transcriptional ArsR family regulator
MDEFCGVMEPAAPAGASVTALLDRNDIIGEPRAGGRRFWTTREIATLKRLWPNLAALVEALPGRTTYGIYQKAAMVGLPKFGKRGGKRPPIETNDHIDAFIRRAYLEATSRGDIRRAALAIGRPRWWVSKRAMQLGVRLRRFSEPPWSDAEIEILHSHAHRSDGFIAAKLRNAGFERSPTAVRVKMNRIDADREDPSHRSACGLAKLFGVDQRTVSRWIDRGLLRAKRKGTNRVDSQGGDIWWIADKDVRAFVVQNVGIIDMRKADKFWLVALLAGK